MNSKPAQQAEHQACESSRKKQKINSEELRSTLVKYGELTQVCYDSFYGDERDTRTFGESDSLEQTASASAQMPNKS